MKLNIKNTLTTELPADVVKENTRRQVENAAFSYVLPKKTAKPEILHVSKEMASELGISNTETKTDFFKNIVTGNDIYALLLENTCVVKLCFT